MKKVLALFSILVLLTMASKAQTKFLTRNTNEAIAFLKVTTDSTPVYIDSIKLSTNQTGMCEVVVIGYQKDTAYSVRGKIAFDFNKRRGTLTLGTITEDVPIVRDAALVTTGIGGASFTAVVVNNNIYIRVKGKHATTIRWYSLAKMYSQQTVL